MAIWHCYCLALSYRKGNGVVNLVVVQFYGSLLLFLVFTRSCHAEAGGRSISRDDRPWTRFFAATQNDMGCAVLVKLNHYSWCNKLTMP